MQRLINILYPLYRRIKNRPLGPKEIKDVLPEHNQVMYVVPQILTKHAEQFLQAAKELWE